MPPLVYEKRGKFTHVYLFLCIDCLWKDAEENANIGCLYLEELVGDGGPKDSYILLKVDFVFLE